jgi:hypothetical protein
MESKSVRLGNKLLIRETADPLKFLNVVRRDALDKSEPPDEISVHCEPIDRPAHIQENVKVVYWRSPPEQNETTIWSGKPD